jgi:pimeloyl-[acyl-carrier protein] methyl ester esterase
MRSMRGMAEHPQPSVADWLLVAGWGFDASIFDELRAALPATIRTQALACHGAAVAIGRRAAAVQAGAAAPFGICAWSLGATIALQQAERCPQAVAALVLAGATPCFVVRPDWPHAMPAADFDAFATLASSSAVAAQSRLAALCALGATDAPAQVRRLRRSFDRPLSGDAAGAFERGLLQDLERLRDVDLRAHLAAIDLPVAVVHGERDALVPAEAARRMAGMLPQARWLPLSAEGHALPITRAGPLAATIASVAGMQPPHPNST